MAEEPAEVIRQQLDWLGRRIVKKTAAALLIACIEQNLPEPAETRPEARGSSPADRLAQGFYEGLTDTQGQSLAEPTASDVRRAQGLVDRLGGDHKASTQTGRAFGQFVRAKERGKASPVRLMSLAVTLYAEEFLAQHGARDKADAKRSSEEARRAHQERFTADYEAFVASLAERVEMDDSILDAFDAEMARKLAGFRRMSARAAEMLEDQLRDERERGRLLVEFAQEKGAIKVPTFWDWDSSRNDDGFAASH